MKLSSIPHALALAVIALAVTVIGAPAHAGAVGPEFVVDGSQPYDRRPVIASLADGGFVVAWAAGSSLNYPPKKIVAQRFSANSKKRGDQIEVSRDFPATALRVAGLADGGFVIVWDTLGGDEILALRFDARGRPLGEPYKVNTTQVPSHEPDLIALRGGGFATAWQRWGLPVRRAFVRSFNKLGEPKHEPVRMSRSGMFSVPKLAQLTDGSIVVTWAIGARIFAQTLDPTGKKDSSAFTAAKQNSEFSVIDENQVVALDGNKFALVWANVKTDKWESGSNIYAAIYGDPDRSGNFTVNSNKQAEQQADPVACRLKDGGVAVAWNRTAIHGINYFGVFYRRFDAAFRPIGDDKQANQTTKGLNYRPNIACLEDGSFVIVWLSRIGESWHIRGQRFSAEE